MEIIGIQKYMHTAPRKLRLVSDMVKKMAPDAAINLLKITPKMAAKDLEKAISTVLANAKVAGLDATKLVFKKIEINESMRMRRFRAGTRGRVRPFKRRMSHIKIVLSDDLKVESQKSKVKNKNQNSEVEEQKTENKRIEEDKK